MRSTEYDRYMGRYSRELTPLFVDFAGIRAPMRVLDVGCGPGALTEILAETVGSALVAAADPSEVFVKACRQRLQEVDVRQASAEALPWPNETFDGALAQLVLRFLDNGTDGVREMARVVRYGGMVAACTWDMSGAMEMLNAFWTASAELDPSAPAEGELTRLGNPEELRDLWTRAGLRGAVVEPLDVRVHYDDFEDFWGPFNAGVGPAGSYYVSLPADQQQTLRNACERLPGFPAGAFSLGARALAVRSDRL